MTRISDNPKIQRAAESFIDAVQDRIAEIAEAPPSQADRLLADLLESAAGDADEIVALRKQNAELVAVLEKIADTRGAYVTSASTLAKSALDTMRLLNDPNRRTD